MKLTRRVKEPNFLEQSVQEAICNKYAFWKILKKKLYFIYRNTYVFVRNPSGLAQKIWVYVRIIRGDGPETRFGAN